MTIHTGEGHLLYWVHWFKGHCHPEIPSQKHPEIAFSNLQTPHDPMKLTHKSAITVAFRLLGCLTFPLKLLFLWCSFQAFSDPPLLFWLLSLAIWNIGPWPPGMLIRRWYLKLLTFLLSFWLSNGSHHHLQVPKAPSSSSSLLVKAFPFLGLLPLLKVTLPSWS